MYASGAFDALASIGTAKRGKIRSAAQWCLLARSGSRWPDSCCDLVAAGCGSAVWLRSEFGAKQES
jgi:hypothetical protein